MYRKTNEMRIRRYIQGHRSGREANRIEREAMRDPFLAEALEGYERTGEKRAPDIDMLRRKIRLRNRRRLDVFKYGSIAASLLFIFAFSIYFGFRPQSGQPSEPVAGFDTYNIYVEKEMIRPEDECKDVKGLVRVGFRVDTSGKPYDIRVEESLCPSADKEAVRLIENGLPWKPSEVRTYYSVEF
jgi:hypothetical protein